MTDSVPIVDRATTSDAAAARQHAPADVAPELYATAQDADSGSSGSEPDHDTTARR